MLVLCIHKYPVWLIVSADADAVRYPLYYWSMYCTHVLVDVAAVSERRQRESDGSTPRAMIFSENNSRVAVLYHTVTVWDAECAANMYCNAGLKNIFLKVFKRRIPPLISSEFLSLENNY